MVEYFPSNNHEDSDDDSPLSNNASKRTARHEPSSPVEQPSPPKEQEGTIFSRADFLPTGLSRPLFDFIRKQEQPAVRSEATSPVGPDFLPSVSVPSDPEVRTYRPPTEVATDTQGEQSEDDDDDEEEEEGKGRIRSVTPMAATPTIPPPAHELQRPLNEQFEEIMRGMGEDFSHATSGEQLGEIESELVTAPGPAAVSEGPHRFEPSPVPEWRPPTFGPPTQERLDPDPIAPPASSYASTPSNESAAFYYSEAEPEPDAPTPAASGGGTPPTAPFANALGGIHTPDNPSYAAAASVESPGVAIPRSSERQEKHNGRWFAAGFITGWVIKQHLANKKLSRSQQAAEKEIGQRDEKINSLALDQQTLQRRVRRNENQLQEAYIQQRRVENSAQPVSMEQPTMSGGQAMEAAAEQTSPAPQPQVAERRPVSSLIEAPLQQSGVAETIYTARPMGEATSANHQRVAEIIPEPETAPQTTTEADAKAYELQSGQHIEHAAGGGHNIVVDKHGHEVQNAIEYGEEFQFQRRQEQARATAASTSSNSPADTTSTIGGNAQEYSLVTGLDSGQADLSHSLPSGPSSPTTRQHLLNSKHDNPIVATVASPWLWAALVVLLLAFFAAAFI